MKKAVKEKLSKTDETRRKNDNFTMGNYRK